MTPVEFFFGVLVGALSLCLVKFCWTACDAMKRMAALLEPVHGEEENGRWWQGMVECAICGERHRAVIPIGEDEDEPSVRMECHKCGSMACDPVDEDE